MSERKVTYEHNDTTVDSETGEVVEIISSKITRVPQTPDFVMAFTQDIGYLSQLSGGGAKLLFGLMQVVDRNNEITLNLARKKSIALATGLKVTSIDSLLNQLKKKEVIISVERGIYALNPYLFGRGQWKNISKMRMNIEYDFDTLKKSVVFENEYNHQTDEDEFLEMIGSVK